MSPLSGAAAELDARIVEVNNLVKCKTIGVCHGICAVLAHAYAVTPASPAKGETAGGSRNVKVYAVQAQAASHKIITRAFAKGGAAPGSIREGYSDDVPALRKFSAYIRNGAERVPEALTADVTADALNVLVQLLREFIPAAACSYGSVFPRR